MLRHRALGARVRSSAVGRIRVTVLVVGAVVLSALLLPGSALADTYTLALPGGFANPTGPMTPEAREA